MHHPAYTRFDDNFFRTLLIGAMEHIFDTKFKVIKNTRDRIILEDIKE